MGGYICCAGGIGKGVFAALRNFHRFRLFSSENIISSLTFTSDGRLLLPGNFDVTRSGHQDRVAGVEQWSHGEGQGPAYQRRWHESLAPLGLLGPLVMKSRQTRTNFIQALLYKISHD